MKNRADYDVVIVGGRVAGSSLAILLSRQGLRVLIVDRQKELGDTVSTHFLNARGLTYLSALHFSPQILEATPSSSYFDFRVDGIVLGGEVTAEMLNQRLTLIHPECELPAVPRYTSIRRNILDSALLAQAQESGAEFLGGVQVLQLDTAGNRVSAIIVQDSEGRQKKITAGLVVGADGKRSKVADLLGLTKQEPRFACTYACYTYFSGLGLKEARLYRKNRLAYAAVPTNHGNVMVLVFFPADFENAFKTDKEKNFIEGIRYVDPEFAQRIQDQGRKEEPFYATADQAAYIRKPGDLIAPLIGDAHSFKDQCTAAGMTHALRDSFLLSPHIVRGLAGDLAEEIRTFYEKRYLDSHKFYIYTCQQAEMNPMRAGERLLFEAIGQSQESRNKLVGIYSDVLSPSELFNISNREKLLRTTQTLPLPKSLHPERTAFENPFEGNFLSNDTFALERTAADFAEMPGPSFEARAEEYLEFYNIRQTQNLYQYGRTLECFPGPTTALSDDRGRKISGINFASQDYLGLGSHPKLREAVLGVLDRFGPHSAGSPMIIGNTLVTKELENELKELTGKKHVVLFPTGYAAGIGSILALVRNHDTVVMDRFSHACLQQGARAATRKIEFYTHLDAEAARAVLKKIRGRDTRNGILIVTEGLFSMDADTPDLKKFQEIAREFNATLFVDVAHDLGAMGPRGTGQAGVQGVYGKLDLVMGSFSKSFATNGGFLASDSEAIIQYVKMYSTPHLFSNALSPLQSAVALASAQIMRSQEGENLRAQLAAVVGTLRSELEKGGMQLLGIPSPIVPVVIGSEEDSRLAHRGMVENNIATMILEYPIVPIGSTRFRLQVMATHTHEQATEVAAIISKVVKQIWSRSVTSPIS